MRESGTSPSSSIEHGPLTSLSPATASRNTPLAPSTEKAYHQKCLELKRRLCEIEDANDATRQRKRRIDRAILKMRLQRAFLLERLAKNQTLLPDGTGAASDKSTSPPQTVRFRPNAAPDCTVEPSS